MKRFIAFAFVLASIGGVDRAYAQEGPAGAGRAEFTVRTPDVLNYTGNVGGGAKWYAGRWGLRDYRFIAVPSKDEASAFFGQEARYGHRVYGAVMLNVGR